MSEHLVSGIAAILGIGLLAQWVAWRVRLPSILLLLVAGFAAGPGGFSLVDPDALLGPLLLPLVAVATALILFEGGLSLNLKELGGHGRTVLRLVTLGLLVTWGLATLAGVLLLKLDLGLCVLVGAILTVSGPTVVSPLLRQIRPRGASGTILQWEGILIDPLGALVAVLVFEAILSGGLAEAAPQVAKGVLLTALVGGGIGVVAALALVEVLRRFWVPDQLHNPLAVAVVVGAFAAANAAQPDSGLFTVTILGVVLANQRKVSIEHILEFKENLRVLLLSAIFVLLAAGLEADDFRALDWGAAVFVGALILVVRPVGVALCTRGSDLAFGERILLAWVFPRGIVAAAVTSVFALRLGQEGVAGAEQLVPLVFLVIVATVVVYGLSAGPLARRLGLSTPNPQGVLLVGAQSWARALATSLREAGVGVTLLDSNWGNVHAARMAGLEAVYGNALHDEMLFDLDLSDKGHLLALTPNAEVNALVLLHYLHVFGRDRLYKVAGADGARAGTDGPPAPLPGRTLFAREATGGWLAQRLEEGALPKGTALTAQFGWDAFRARHGKDALPLCTVSESGQVRFATADQPLKPQAGQTVVALVGGGAEAAARP